MVVAGLDFGSNTTLLLIAEVRDGRIGKVLCDETRVTKMGQGVHHSKRFHPDALARIDQALADYRKLIDIYQPDKIKAVATSAARDVENSDQLFAMARKYGIEIEVISGTREAELTYQGAFSGREEKPGTCVIDVGGGSTELIYKRAEDQKIVGQSIDVGSVRLMDLFGAEDPLPEEEFEKMRAYVKERLNPKWPKLGLTSAVAVAGTPTILAAMEMGLDVFDADRIDGFRLRKERLEFWMRSLRKLSLPEREAIRGLPPQRADVIVAGCVVLYEFLDHIGLDEMDVSVRGVRFGVVLS